MGDRRAAIVQFNQGSEEATRAKQGKGDFNLAYQLHSSAVMNDDSAGLLWHELGNDLSDLQLSAAALAAHRRAIELPDGEVPGDISPAYRAKSLVQLAYRLHVLGRNLEAGETINKALKLDPKVAQAWCVASLIHSIEGQHLAAIDCAKRGLELEPDNATIETALGLNLMFDGQFREGLKHYEARFRYKLRHFLTFPYPQWKGEFGKTLYIVADQGLGDTLSFARFVRQAVSRCKFVYIGAQKELVRLFKASFQDIPNIEIITPNAVGWPPADCWTTFVSLPSALDLSEDEFRNAPSITIPQFSVSTIWKAPDRFNIGVAWKGSPLSDIAHHKSFPVEMLLRLYEVQGIQLYSLQTDAALTELHTAGCAALIRDMSPFIQDVADTTAILRDLDLVITVESALGHIASACGVECWIPYSRLGRDYRASHDGSHPIWAPKHTFFRQGNDKQWEPVFSRIVNRLKEKLSG